jgi:2-polyprenyl-6-methoxyphenol hydroxylase-like FAD-dependent oxidoreductase
MNVVVVGGGIAGQIAATLLAKLPFITHITIMEAGSKDFKSQHFVGLMCL